MGDLKDRGYTTGVGLVYEDSWEETDTLKGYYQTGLGWSANMFIHQGPSFDPQLPTYVFILVVVKYVTKSQIPCANIGDGDV